MVSPAASAEASRSRARGRSTIPSGARRSASRGAKKRDARSEHHVVAFGGEFLATPLVEGGVTTIGILVGIGVILIAIVLTAIYVWKANTTFDDLTRELLEETR